MSDTGLSVTVVFFASLREALGQAELQLELREGNFGAVRELLEERLGDRSEVLWAENVRLAHNQELVACALDSLVLQSGDELAFLPPVTGG